jgi:hypothetical protein
VVYLSALSVPYAREGQVRILKKKNQEWVCETHTIRVSHTQQS